MAWSQTTTPSLASLGAQPLDSDLTAIAALSTTAFGRSFLALADAAGVAQTLGWLNVAPPNSQRRFRSAWADDAGSNIMTADQLIMVYCGYTVRSVICKHVDMYVGVAGVGAQTAEVGLFSSPSAPNKGNQTLTCLVASGTLDSLTTTGTKRNTTAFNAGAGYTVPAGTHLWAGFRTNMATTQPQMSRLLSGMKDGSVLQTNTAGVITATNTYAGTVLIDGTQPPNLHICMDT